MVKTLIFFLQLVHGEDTLRRSQFDLQQYQEHHSHTNTEVLTPSWENRFSDAKLRWSNQQFYHLIFNYYFKHSGHQL